MKLSFVSVERIVAWLLNKKISVSPSRWCTDIFPSGKVAHRRIELLFSE